MSHLTLERMVEAGSRPARLTVEQYHSMVDLGVLPEGTPIELLAGFLVYKDRSAMGEGPMTVGKRHCLVVTRIVDLAGRIRATAHHLRIQAPITIPPDHEPEPDAAIVSGSIEDYRDRHPNPRDVACVIEVADSSLLYDRSVKLEAYAEAGIARYVIVNLQDGVIEVYRNPSAQETRYLDRATARPGQSVILLEAPEIEVEASYLLGL